MKSGSVLCLLKGTDSTELPLTKAHLIFSDKTTLTCLKVIAQVSQGFYNI